MTAEEIKINELVCCFQMKYQKYNHNGSRTERFADIRKKLVGIAREEKIKISIEEIIQASREIFYGD